MSAARLEVHDSCPERPIVQPLLTQALAYWRDFFGGRMCALILLGAGMRHAWGARSGSKRLRWKAVQSCSLTRSPNRSVPWVW